MATPSPTPKPTGHETLRQHARRTRLRIYFLENDNRAKLYHQISETPGLNINLLAQRTSLPSRSHASFHIHRMHKADLVTIHKKKSDGQNLCFLPQDAHLYDDPQTRPLYGRAPTRQVALHIAENPGTTIHDLTRVIQKADSTMRYHLQRLKAHDLIHEIRIENTRIYDPTATLEEWTEEVGREYVRAEEVGTGSNPT